MKSPIRRGLGSFLVLCLLGGILLLSPYCAFSKEIEASDEWQLIGENDTLPAGMHIRMDLTTGEKWAKKMTEEETETTGTEETLVSGAGDSMSTDSSSTGLAAVATVASTEEVPDNDKVSNRDDEEEEPDYDFDMMHRTLSQLPPEEHERMGGLPELPQGKTVESLSPKERELFELRMRQIWKQRQDELRQIEEENVADLPQILKDRIQSIRDYLHDPVEHLQMEQLNKPSKSRNDDDDNSLDTIVAILGDLEYLLTDLDMARDFYTLGGWPLLGSLLSNDVHGSLDELNTNTVANETESSASLEASDYIASVHLVQAHAAWVLGTAVKNAGEFIPWTVEGIKIGSTETNTLELLQNAFTTSLSYGEEGRTKSLETLQQKALYALGSFLRGNTLAQFQFSKQNGPALLAHSIDLCANDNYKSRHCVKMTQRVLSLASDVLLESQQLESNKDEDKGMGDLVPTILQAFTNESWCHSLLRALEGPQSLQSEALRSLPTWQSQCQWQPTEMRQAMQKLWEDWKGQDAATFSDEMTIIQRYLSGDQR